MLPRSFWRSNFYFLFSNTLLIDLNLDSRYIDAFSTILCHWKEKCVEKVSLFVQKNICLGEKNKAVKIFEDIASRNSKENAYFVWVV